MSRSRDDINRIAELLRPLERRIADLDSRGDERIKELDSRVEQRMEELSSRFEQRTNTLEARFDEIRDEITNFRIEVNGQFKGVQNNFDALFSRDERREQEYVVLRGQISRLEERAQLLEEKAA